jgi:hypothetical protein
MSSDSDADTDEASEERVLSDRSSVEEWAEENAVHPVLSDTPEGALSLDFDDDPDADQRLDWDAFFSLYESSEVTLVVSGAGDRHRFVDGSRIRGQSDEDQTHPDGDPRDPETIDRETDQIERDARDRANPDDHRDEPFKG